MKNNEYSIEVLEKTFEKNAILCEQENERLLEEYKKNCPGEVIPDWYTMEFNINTALAAMCAEIIKLRDKFVIGKHD